MTAADVQRPCKCGGRFGVVGTGCATWCPGPTDPAPVTADVQRDQLAAVLLEHSPVYSEVYDEQRCACGAPLWDGIDVHHAAALLPVVREIAAEELRAAADDPRIGYVARHIRARAAALDPAGAASGETT